MALQAVALAESFIQDRLKPAAAQLADQAVPTAKEFTEGQLQPAARAVADNVHSILDFRPHDRPHDRMISNKTNLCGNRILPLSWNSGIARLDGYIFALIYQLLLLLWGQVVS